MAMVQYRRGQLPPQVLDELEEVLRQRNPQAQPHLPRDEEVDQPHPVDEQQVPAPPQPEGWGWKAAYAVGTTLFGAMGFTTVAVVHGTKKLVDLATAPREENLEVAV